jgi:glucans biosynthesis protein C
VLSQPLFARGILHRDTPIDSILANVFTWSAVLAFIGYGRRFLSFQNTFLRWAREAAYPVYILHQTLMLIIAYWIIQLSWAPWTKYWAVLAGTLISSVVLYQLAIRPFRIMRVLFGLKPDHARSSPAERIDANSTMQTANATLYEPQA